MVHGCHFFTIAPRRVWENQGNWFVGITYFCNFQLESTSLYLDLLVLDLCLDRPCFVAWSADLGEVSAADGSSASYRLLVAYQVQKGRRCAEFAKKNPLILWNPFANVVQCCPMFIMRHQASWSKLLHQLLHGLPALKEIALAQPALERSKWARFAAKDMQWWTLCIAVPRCGAEDLWILWTLSQRLNLWCFASLMDWISMILFGVTIHTESLALCAKHSSWHMQS